METASRSHVAIAIAGTGFAGLGAAIRLKQAGFTDFLVFERADDVGGVWRDNTYPGAACDVESHLYSFSFAPNPGWSHAFSRQPEILDYLRGCARDHGIMPHIRFGHSVQAANWDNAKQQWVIETSRGVFTADFFLSGVGALSEPSIPAIPGLETFQGKVFHSAQWQHDHDLKGRQLAVIGTGASVVQFLPEIQPLVQKLTLFQRTPAWVLPRWDQQFSAWQKRLYGAVPALQKWVRRSIYLRRELFVQGFRHPALMRVLEFFARRYMARIVANPALRAKLTPDFRMGCKRILLTDAYLPALTRDNVELVSDKISEVRAHAIVTADGREHPVDTIIFGTGFHVLDMPFADRIRGRDGRTLNQVWSGSPSAYLGTTVAGFPNFFQLLGSGTGLGHTSVVLMLESQLQIVLGALRHMEKQRMDVVEPRPEIQAQFSDWLQQAVQGTVWTAGGCASWYLDSHGKLTSLWPHTTLAFRRRARFRPAEYVLTQRASRAQVPARPATPPLPALTSNL